MDAVPYTDGVQRFFDRHVGLRPVRVVAFVALLMMFSFAARALMPDPWGFGFEAETLENPFFWLDLLNMTIIAYVLIAGTIARRGVLADLEALRPSLDLDEARFAPWPARLTAAPRTRLFWAGLAFAIFLAAAPVFDESYWLGTEPVPVFSPQMLYFVFRGLVTGCLAGRLLCVEYQASRGFAELGARHVRIDPFDLRPLRPLARKGLRSAALWLVASALVSLFWLGPAAGTTNGPIVAVVLVLALWVFLHPIVAVHGAILEAKQAKLDVVRREIRAEEARLVDRREASAADGRMADLVAWYQLLAGTREWPLEAPIVLRFALFAVLGLGSWLGAALVERGLERIFG